MTTNSAGRPKDAKASEIETLKTKSLHEIKKFDAKMINKLPKLYSMLEDIAFGTGNLGKNASITNRKSSIETLIARAELYAKEEGMAQEAMNNTEKPEEEIVEEQTSEKQVANGSTVVSEMTFAERKAEFKRLQAEKNKEK